MSHQPLAKKVTASPALTEVIGALAIAEHFAWKDRNAKRKEFRAWLHAYRSDTGEWFEPGGEPEDDANYVRLKSAVSAAQKGLATARAATRRVIAIAVEPQ